MGGNAAWTPPTASPARWVLKVETVEPFHLTKVRLMFAAERKPWNFKVSTALEDAVGGKLSNDGRMITWNYTSGFSLQTSLPRAEQQWKVLRRTLEISTLQQLLSRLSALVRN